MKLLTKEDIIKVAEKLDIKPAILFAIDKTESAGSGFYLDGSKYSNDLKVLFEGHIFHRFTDGKFDKDYPTLSYPKWIKGVTTKFYRRGSSEFERFLEATKLDKLSAQLSTSYGRYQTCGFNFEKCGYKSVVEMILDYYKGGEISQFIAFLSFCENTYNRELKKNLIELLQEFSKTNNKSYLKGFVRSYNGSGQVDAYTNKILKYIKEYK